MLSVVIPTLNAASRLPYCLDALIRSAASGVVREIIVVDGGSSDESLKIADGFGAHILTAPPGRGGQLRAGAATATREWILFLHADTILEDGWEKEARDFINLNIHKAGVFRLAFDAKGIAPRLVSFGANFRTHWINLPYGDQGLLIAKAAYADIGGYADIPIFEDVEFVKRLVRKKGSQALHVFQSTATTSAARYKREGYMRRAMKNFVLLMRFQLGASPKKLAALYY